MNKSVDQFEVLKSLSDATAGIVSETAPSVVAVSNGMGRGTGVVWSSDGYIVTCSHVVGKRSILKVGLGDGKICEARLVGRDPFSDVALLKIEEEGLSPIELGDSENLKPGQFVLALANPFNRSPSVVSGIVTSAGVSIPRWGGAAMENVVVTDAQLNPGYSGGPLLDASGRMIGMNTAYVSSRGIAVPVSTVKQTAESLKSERKIKRAYLGIVSSAVSIPPEVVTEAELSQDSGVIVFSVEPGSPAKKAGLALGDVIMKFNEKPVTSMYDLPRLLTQDVIGKEARLVILRGEKPVELIIIPSAAKNEIDG